MRPREPEHGARRRVRHTPRPGRLLRRACCAGLFAVASTVSLAGCAATRNELGLSDGLCYVALPAANAAVHGQGSLLGLRLRRVSDLLPVRQLPRMSRIGRGMDISTGTRLCLVAFRGDFSSSDVTKPRGLPSGRVAVVVLTYPNNRLLATVILRHPPLPFGHSHFQV